MNTVFRHLHIYKALVSFCVSRSMEFRFDFFFRFIMDVFFYALSIAFFEVLFLHTTDLGGWQRHQVLLFVSGGLLIDAVYMTFIARSTWELPRLINRGELDFQLIRPINSLFFVMTRHFEFASFLNILVALGIMLYAFSIFPDPITFFQLSGFFLLLLNGLVLGVSLRMFTVLPVFWTHSELGFHMLFMSLEQVTERPEVIFRGATHLLFTTLLPFLIVTSFPARWFFGDLAFTGVLYAFFISSLFFTIMVFIWHRGLKIYSSASS
jgi:ABC-2 type transport system permease protein